MRAVQIALLVISLQIGMGIVTMSGLFSYSYYEAGLTNIDVPDNPEALSELEQSQTSINFLNTFFDALTWGWIKYYFMPWYNMNVDVAGFVNGIILLLNGISSFLIGIAFIEFVRNRTEVLG